MSIIEIFSLAFALGLDVFSVGVVVGISSAEPRQIFRLSWHFGLFQFLMPILGWLVGNSLLPIIGSANKWLAFAILVLIGVKMIHEAWHPAQNGHNTTRDRTRGWSLIFLSIATSIDALGAGIGLGVLAVKLLRSCLIIGLVAGLMTFAGMKLGNKLSKMFPRRMEVIGGLVLIGLAVKMVI